MESNVPRRGYNGVCAVCISPVDSLRDYLAFVRSTAALPSSNSPRILLSVLALDCAPNRTTYLPFVINPEDNVGTYSFRA